jgi:hypothetical protein
MRKNVTIGFSPPEYMRLLGAAAVTNMPITTYVKWLLRGGLASGDSQHLSAVLERLDQIGVALARLPRVPQVAGSQQQSTPVTEAPARALVETKLRERGIPTSTIRQLTAVLDELRLIRE